MKTDAYVISQAKPASHVLLIILACFISQRGFCQEYTAKDSVSFRKSLAESRSEADRITHQLELADYSIKKPGSVTADWNIARMWIDKAIKSNEKLKSREAEGYILLEESSLFRVNGQASKGKPLITKAIPLLKNSPDKCLLAKAYRALSNYYDAENPEQKNSKTDLLKQSLTLFNHCGNKLEEALTLQDLSETYLATGNFPLALKSLNESHAILTAIDYKRLQRLYNLFGIYYFVQSNYENCLQYQFKALEICKQMNDSTSLYCEVNNIIGMSFMDLNEYDKAISYFKNALVVSKKNKDMGTFFSISINISTSFSKLNKPEESLIILNELKKSINDTLFDTNNKVTFDYSYLAILLKLHHYKSAAKYAKELLSLINQPSLNKFNITRSYNILFKYYYAIKEYDQALVCLKSNEKFLQKAGVPLLNTKNLKLWYTLDSAKGDFKNAFFNLLKFKTLDDSIFTEKKSEQIQQLQVKYETQKKEDEIKILTQNAKIDQVQLKAAQFTRNVTLAGILAFILIAGQQYWRYREKQKINLVITEKNASLQELVKEKEWLLKEIHHRVKNNLHTVICLLESQAIYLENDALKAIEISRHRIYAMSLIHQKLYQSDDIKVVDIKTYLNEFVEYLRESFGSPEHVQVILHAESIKLGIAQAIPIGLIINETITNAFKYAFPAQKKGEINIELKRKGDEIYLSVIDNGIGFKQQAEQEINSLGLELVKGLTLDLRGTVSIDADNGTSILIRFMIDQAGVAADEEDLLTFNS